MNLKFIVNRPALIIKESDNGRGKRCHRILERSQQASLDQISERVPKIIRFRHDKKIDEIDDIEKVRKLYEMQYERYVQKTV